MIQVGKYNVGPFYLKDCTTYCEIGGTHTVPIKEKYAKTSTNNVLLMLDENNEIVDIDDLPSFEANQRCGENIISFVLGKKACCFVIGEEMFLDMEMSVNKDGKVSQFQVVGEDFNLGAHMDTSSTFSASDLQQDRLLFVYLDDVPQENIGAREVFLFLAEAKIIPFM